METTTYRLTLDTEEPGEDDDVVRGTHCLTFKTKEEADAAIPLLRTAIKQGARCGKVRVSPLLSYEEWARIDAAGMGAEQNAKEEALDAAWRKLDLPDYIWLTGIKSYRKVTEEDLTIGGM
jgi:hypothetical protein